MATPRTPLSSTTGNRQRGPELSPYQRGLIIGATIGGMSPREIEDEMQLSRGAIRTTIAMDETRSEGVSCPRSGRPRIYTDRDDRMMLRHLRFYPKAKFEARRKDTGLKMSNTYIKNLARRYGIHHWRAKKRPELTSEVAALRLLWCRVRRHWTVDQWRTYMFSDECSAERGRGKEIEWVFGLPKDKWKPEMVTTYKKGKDIRVMVWAAFWGYGERCKLYIMDRDFESLKNGYSANSYLAVLEERVLESYHDDLVFMQDNAPIHTAHVVRDWFYLNGVRTTDWPPYSPDLNPIENAWWALKKLAMEKYPEVMTSSGKTEEDIKKLEDVLKVCWDELPDSLFESLIQSMPRRMEACIEAKGWHTKY